jgi:hypothetical protein
VEDDWKCLKQAMKGSAVATIGYEKKKKAKKPWITEEMIKKMDERRSYRGQNSATEKEMYKKLNNELRRETDRARELWWENTCQELEELEEKGRIDLLYGKIKQITRERKTPLGMELEKL